MVRSVQDEVITNLVKTALSQSHDLEATTQRVIQARAQLGISRSQLAPNITAAGSYNATRSSSIGSFVSLQPGTILRPVTRRQALTCRGS